MADGRLAGGEIGCGGGVVAIPSSRAALHTMQSQEVSPSMENYSQPISVQKGCFVPQRVLRPPNTELAIKALPKLWSWSGKKSKTSILKQ